MLESAMSFAMKEVTVDSNGVHYTPVTAGFPSGPPVTLKLDDYLDLGRLKGNVGNQHYILLDDVDVSVYQSAVVYCKQFETVITSARLR